MQDYRSTLRSAQEIWRKKEEDLTGAFEAELEQFAKQQPKYDFIRALFQHARGNSTYLVKYLRSPRPLTRQDREHFARVLEGDLQQKKKRGRPVDRDERHVATEALQFYRLWRTENKRIGFKDHGLSKQMKDDAVTFLIGDPDLTLNREKIRQLMDRPQSRRG